MSVSSSLIGSCRPIQACGISPACSSDMQVLPALDAEGVDLLRRLLQYNPKERITAAEAVRHPLAGRRCPGGA